jgi:translation initiation factor IF-3
VGILPSRQALALAQEQGLDLVEVAPDAQPPVCKIMDFGKYRYELSKREKEAKKKQHIVHLKEIRLRPKIDDHDYQVKLRQAREFLIDRNKVKVTMIFRGREITHLAFGKRRIEQMVRDLADIAQVEQAMRKEGRNLTMVVAPK